ncbi:MAG TPA: Spy/CpxP family protein refolding chaperone [Spirochaetota bacterium]|nr:Spy/CpxP family protein refolding chaperone [Spirochaetota bacterium]
MVEKMDNKSNRIIIIILSVIVILLVIINIALLRGPRPLPLREPGKFFGDGRAPMFMERGDMPGHRLGRNFCSPEFMEQRLRLSAEQKEKINRLNDKYEKDLSSFFDNSRELRDKLKEILQKDGDPDYNVVRTLLEKISSINVEIQLMRIKQGKEIDSILTQKQREILQKEREMMFRRMRFMQEDGR